METQLDLFPAFAFAADVRPKLVAFSGRAGSGKSVAAQALINVGFVRVKFASPLKNMLRAYYKTVGLDTEQIERRVEGDLKEAPDEALQGRSPRHAMVTLGTEWGRDLMAQDFWVAAWRTAVMSQFSKGRNVVVDDCRFANEVDAVHELGGVVVAITQWKIPDPSAQGEPHRSEKFDFTPDKVISNCSTIDSLRDNALRVIGRNTQ